MAIAYYAEDIQLPAIKKKAVSGWIKAVAETYGKKTGDISYIFCSDEKILEVNRQYLQHDYYTDIITFDYTEGNKISGDLFISLDTVRTNAETFHTDYNEELDIPPARSLTLCSRSPPYHHPRHPAPLRYQRQRPRRAGDHGGEREQSVSDLAGGMSVKRC